MARRNPAPPPDGADPLEVVPLGERCWCGKVHRRCAAHKKRGYAFPTAGVPCTRHPKRDSGLPVCGLHLDLAPEITGAGDELDVDDEVDGDGSLLAAAKVSRLELLRALRNLVARRIDAGVPPRDLASLTKRLLDIAREVEELEAIAEDAGGVGAAAATADEPWDGDEAGDDDVIADGDESWDGG